MVSCVFLLSFPYQKTTKPLTQALECKQLGTFRGKITNQIKIPLPNYF
jgi:hypothetical protein